MIWQLFFISLLTWIWYYRFQRRRLYKIAKNIPSGLKSYPIIGHSYLISGDDEDRMSGFQKMGRKAMENGGLSTIWLVNKLYLNVADPVAAEIIAKKCLQKDETTSKYIRTLIGNGSIFARVNIWRPRRKILAPTFSPKNLNQFVAVFEKHSTVMTNLLAPKAGTGDFSIWKYFTTYSFDAICETTLNINLNAQSMPNVPFLTAFDSLMRLGTQRICTPWMYPDFIYKNLTYYKQFNKDRQLVWDFVDELVQTTRRVLKARELEGKNTRMDQQNSSESSGMKAFLEMMIEMSGKMGSEYTNLELREEAMVILFAGTDTSAVGSAFITVMLSRHPDVQEKVYQELQDVFGNSERPVTVEDLPNLKYLEVVIKETLRLYPPVPINTKEIEEDVELPTGDILVDGTKVLINIWALHRNPKYWGEDAEQFRPERFFEAPLTHPAQYQPFSLGARGCLGLNYAMYSMKTVVANLIRRYKILPPQNMDPIKIKEPLKVKYNIMMKPVDDYIVRLVKRE